MEQADTVKLRYRAAELYQRALPLIAAGQLLSEYAVLLEAFQAALDKPQAPPKEPVA